MEASPAPSKPPHGLGPGDLRRLAVAVAIAGAVLAVATITFRRGGWVVFAGLAACAVWAFAIEPRRLTVTRLRLATPRRPKGARPLRIVHVTDLQCDPRPRLEDRLPLAIEAERPDLVLFTGDAVNSAGGVPVFRRCMERLARIAPTFAVTGNWEVWNVPGVDPYAGTGAILLSGEGVRVPVEGGDVWVAGVGADEAALAPRALERVPAGALTVFLHHYPDPDVVPEAARGRVDLMLAGHVHGGQVAVPFYGALLTLHRHGKRYEQGLYEVGPMKLFVGRGIGMEGKAPRLRFCAPPEIAVIEIAGE